MTDYRPMTAAQLLTMDTALATAAALCGGEGFPELPALQALYDRLLASPLVASEVEALGYAFGAHLARDPGLSWAWMIDEDYGDEPGVVVTGKTISCAPLSMIRHRLEDGEAWDLAELLEDSREVLREHAAHAGNT